MTTNKRTIYRGKTIKTDTWVYGNVLYNNKGEALITNSDGTYIVDGGTVGQYIGLNDSLDTPIYDGDIVMLTTKTTIDKATVVWDGIKAGYFYLVIDKTGGWAINPDKFIKWNSFGNTIEVVGNIHEEE